MKRWALHFWTDHGSRLVFGAIATGFGSLFWFIGMKEEATMLWTGVAMLAYNKARSDPKESKSGQGEPGA